MSAIRTALALTLLLAPISALAYIGPGSGISLLGGLWSVLVGVVLALAAILIWPVRLMIKRMRRRKAEQSPGESPGGSPGESPAPSADGE